MDLTMSIATLSMNMHQAQFQQDYDIALLKQTMDTQEATTNALIDILDSVPSFGHLLDARA